MALVSLTPFVAGTVLTAAALNNAFNAIVNQVNGALDTTNLAANSVGTSQLATGAVTGAKIAMGSDAQGDTLYYNGSAYARLAAATAGKFLKTQGASANPDWDFVYSPSADLTDASTISVNAALSNYFRVTLAGNRTLGNPTNAKNGQKIMFEIIQDGTGSRTLAYDTKFAFGLDLAGATLSTGASKRDFLGVVYNSTADKFYALAFVRGYS